MAAGPLTDADPVASPLPDPSVGAAQREHEGRAPAVRAARAAHDAASGAGSGPSGLAPELEALVLCSLAARSPLHDQRLAEILSGGFDWGRFWDEAGTQQVQPLVARELAGTWLNAIVPPDLARAAREARLQTIGYNLAVHGELQSIGRALRARGIDVAPLKGTHLAQRLFGALDARRVGDIDILVPEERLEDARAVLFDLGYGRRSGASVGIEEHSFHGVPYIRVGPNCSFVVELHWGLNNPRFVSVEYAGLWRRIREAAPAGAALMPLPSEETLLFLALHLPKHDLGVLRLIADIDRLLRVEGGGIDWDRVLSTAARWRVSQFLYFALHRARVTLGSPVPEAVMRRLRPHAWRRTAVELLAPPQSLLAPPAHGRLRYNRYRLAYCAMVSPLARSLQTYAYYLFAEYGEAPGGILGRARGVGRCLYRETNSQGAVATAGQRMLRGCAGPLRRRHLRPGRMCRDRSRRTPSRFTTGPRLGREETLDQGAVIREEGAGADITPQVLRAGREVGAQRRHMGHAEGGKPVARGGVLAQALQARRVDLEGALSGDHQRG